MSEQRPYQSTVPPNSTLAIVSLVCGILGLSLVPGIASVIAIITGGMAMKEIRESNGGLGGEGMARIGIILGWIAVALVVLGVCCAIVFTVFPVLLTIFAAGTTTSGFLPGLGLLFG